MESIDLRDRDTGQRTVAHCDDDPVLRVVVTSMLESDGWRVVAEAATAADLIHVAEATQPDLCIVDVSLHGMTGIEALPRIKALSPRTKIVVLTAFEAASTDATEAGADAVLTKAELTSLTALVDELVPDRSAVRA